jgi:2-dehydropantoate 2-reductase
MRFIVIGAGAIGGVVGARLAAAEREVVLVARGAQFAALRERGLRLETPEGAITVQPQVVDHPSRITWRTADVVLLAVKTQDAAAALRDLAAVAPADTPVACFTNGLEAERLALRWFRHVLGVCVMCPATFIVPGVVQAWALPVSGMFDLGVVPQGRSPVADELAGALTASGLPSEPLVDVLRWKRRKLLSNLINAIDALSGPSPGADELVQRARSEGAACFAAANLAVASPEEDAARRKDFRLGAIEGRKREGGSTWQSLARGAGAVECDYLNGEIALLGRLFGVPTPVNDRLQFLVAEAARTGAAPACTPIDELIAKLG